MSLGRLPLPDRRLPAAFAVALALAGAARAEDRIDYTTARLSRRLQAVRAQQPITLDGVIDDREWGHASVARDFVQNEPREGEPATERTEVRVLYDDEALYFGIVAYDSEPDRLVVPDLRKDFVTQQSDAVGIVLDTFRDERNGYMFAVNPMGARYDAQMTNEGREVNANWDGIWRAATRVTAEGWSAEIAIPFRTLKFSKAEVQTWGVNFVRRVRRKNEDSYWAPLPRIYQLYRVSLAGTLEGLTGIRAGSNLRVKPYALAAASRVGAAPARGDGDVGCDVKYAVTSGLTWDFTYNTDFSQVEADEQQINLTRFSLFFPEKRDFFLENSGIFQFGPSDERMPGGGGGGPGGQVGGRQNAVRNDLILFFSRRIGLSEDGRAIPILAGTRLTGRAGAYTIGALNIQQRASDGTPAANVTAVRVRRDVFANSDVGVMVLAKETAGPADNRVIGGDANFRFFTNLQLNAFAAKTFSPEPVLPGRGRDTTARVNAEWRGRFWDFRGSYITIGDRFRDELGFVPRTGVAKTAIFTGVHWRPERVSGWIREIFPHWELSNVVRHESRGGGLDSRYIDYHLPVTLQDGTFLEIGLNPTTEDIPAPFTISRRRGIVIVPGRYRFDEWFALWRTNPSARLSFNGRYSIGGFYDGYRRGYTVGATGRMNERLQVSGTLGVNDITLPAGAFVSYLFTGRIDYSFSTRAFLNALLQYNTDAEQWSANVRFNIIHRPLSDFFLVYNERRSTRGAELIDRALVAKLTWLVAF